jgi:hypothetical protein
MAMTTTLLRYGRAALLLLLPAALAGQDSLSLALAPGTRVRVTTVCLTVDSAVTVLRRQVATVVASRSDRLVLAPVGRARDTVSVGLADVTLLEVSQGRRRHTGKGVAVGAGVGAATGVVFTALANKRCEGDDWCIVGNIGRGVAIVSGGVIGAMGGALVGGVIGATHVTERWRTVPLQVALLPRGTHGFAVTVSLGLGGGARSP